MPSNFSAKQPKVEITYGKSQIGPRRYRYKYVDKATMEMNNLPERIVVFNHKPFENNMYNKYYVMMLRNLHPKFNFVSVHNGDRLIPVNSRLALMNYLGNISYVTLNRFLNEMTDNNILLIIKSGNNKTYYMINPAYASDKRMDYKLTIDLFALTNEFSKVLDMKITLNPTIEDMQQMDARIQINKES